VKVLTVIDSLSFGGAENVLVTLAAEAPRQGFSLDVVALTSPANASAEWLPRLLAAGLRPTFLGIDRLLQPSAVLRLVEIMHQSGADVVHAHLEYASTLAPIAARLARLPALCTFHHVPGPLTGRDAIKERLAVAVASRSAGLITVSRASYEGLAARYPRSYDPSRWAVVHNGVDLRRFRPLAPGDSADLPAEFGIPEGVPIVALAGHMRIGKGQDVALRAWPQVLAVFPDAHLLLLGNGPLENSLRQLTCDLGVESRVVFGGARDDIAQLLPRVSLVVLPTHMEALPTVLLEAGACGVASVATDVGGVAEVVADGETGWLVGSPNPQLFAVALKEALADPGERLRRGRAARRRAEHSFDAEAWAGRLAACYHSAAAGRAVGAT
jgi:glycosyltransferase involved in cell wall biosynthesis